MKFYLFLSVCLLTLTAAVDFNTPIISNGKYFYSFFQSGPDAYTPVNGESSVGVFCRPGAAGTRGPNLEVVFPDMCGFPAIRVINTDGYISRLAGSFTEESNIGGTTSGVIDGVITYADGTYYYSDPTNNVVRQITLGGVVSVYLNNTIVNGQDTTLNRPLSLTTFRNANTDYLIVSDTGNTRTLYVTLTNSGGLATIIGSLTGVTVQALTTSPDLTVVYYITNLGVIGAVNMVETASVAPWTIGEARTNNVNTQFGSLVYSKGYLYYIGNGGVILRINAASGLATPALPETVFTMPAQASSTGEPRLLIPREINNENPKNADNFYIVTRTAVYIASDRAVLPPDGGDSSSSGGSGGGSSSSGNGNGSSSSSNGSGSGSGSHSSNSNGGDSSSSDGGHVGPYDPSRAQGLGAYPMSAFPTSDPCLMSQIYQAMRDDVTTAVSTQDYYSEFVPLGDIDKTVYGTWDVSTWCSNITGDGSNDRTVSILPYRGPVKLPYNDLRNALRGSPWTKTRALLDRLTAEGYHLEPFCFIDCASLEECRQLTYSPDICYDPDDGKCDDICKGAIAASVVLGAAGVVLIVLMILAPVNIFTALIMVPII